jgi:hypothetical protein
MSPLEWRQGRPSAARGPLGSVFKLSVGETGHAHLLEIEGIFTQGSRTGQTFGESVGGIFEMDSSDWSNGIRYRILNTRPGTEFKLSTTTARADEADATRAALESQLKSLGYTGAL